MTNEVCLIGHDSAASSGAHFAHQCALNVYNSSKRNSPEGRAINRWMTRRTEPPCAPSGVHLVSERERAESDYYPASHEGWRDIGVALEQAALFHGPVSDIESAWIAELKSKLRLDPLASQILALAIYYEFDDATERLWDNLSHYHRNGRIALWRDARRIAKLLGASAADVAGCFRPYAPLIESGLLWIERSGNITLCQALRFLVEAGVAPGRDMCVQLLGEARTAKLPWQSFKHIQQEAEIAASIVRGAVAREEPGINILLYGPPGTGKTSFAATLAAHVDAKLFLVAETNENGQEPSRADRLASLRLAQCLASERNVVLLFDEAEDVLAESDDGFGTPRRSSRAFVHRLLEQNRVPVIWTANDIGTLGPAVLRRMTMCMELRIPNIETRTLLWCDIARIENIALANHEAARLARLVPAAPAVSATALRAAQLAGGNAETVQTIVEGITRAVHGGRLPTPEFPPDETYDPSLINADHDLAALTERLSGADLPRRISFLLSGPPGTGKSAWLRHLAKKMGLPVLQKRASDLLGGLVGDTEKQIAAAFAEARADRAFLIFDEAESLLFDRTHATRSWELSQINEMLTWMSEHAYPFACTTNLVERLDEASLRRFLIKIRLGWLRPSQARVAFHTFFGLVAPPGLDALTTLAPADFALVRRLTRVSGASADAATILRLLAAECRGRAGGTNRIGFVGRHEDL